MATIIAKKDLFADTGQKNFTKGNEYELDFPYSTNEPLDCRSRVVADDQGDKHWLSTWYKHFKIKKDAK